MPSPTQPITLRFKKIPGGATALSCTRADGSVTWQRTSAAHAAFFARHDLTHYAVETVLGYGIGFYGLLAAGWEFTDFGAPWPCGPIPADADPAELIVGFFDAERAGDRPWTTEQFNEFARSFYGEAHSDPPVVTADQLSAIRQRMSELFQQWDAINPGETLELSFPQDASAGIHPPGE